MKVDLLTAIGELKGMTDVFVMTHNIDFVFLQTLALGTFNRGGQPRITVFADAHCAQDSFAAQRRLLSGLGSRYRVVPVAMQPKFRFHPKAVLLAGEETATLFVGSGNLGFAGWRENAEVWVRFDVATDGMRPFAEFRDFAAAVIDAVALNEGPRQVLSEIFDPTRNRWAAAAAAGASPSVVGRAGQGEDLLQHLVRASDLDAVDELYVCCPYYDQHGEALKRLIEAFAPAKTTLLYQPLGSTLSAAACAANAGARLLHVGFARDRQKWGGPRQAFVHAKFYALRRGDQVLVLAGSANCSVAALTLRGQAGNAELMAVHRISRTDFEQDWLGALQLMETGASPPDDPHPEDEADHSNTPTLRILAARFCANHQVLVAFSPPGAHISECLVDGAPASFKLDAGGGRIMMAHSVAPRTVEICGVVDGLPLRSNLAWVDDEDKLRQTQVRSPALAALKTHAHDGTWSAGAWADVMDLFAKHLSQTAAPPARARGKAARDGSNRPAPPGLYAPDDVLATTANTRRSGSTALTMALHHLGGHCESTLPALLKQWFASSDDPPGDVPSPFDTDLSDGRSSGTPPDHADDDDEPVDAPTRFQKNKNRGRAAAGGRHRPPQPARQMDQILKTMTAALAAPGFCAHRPAKLLSVDLQLVALLLGTALRERWISPEQHLDVSRVAWGSLFLHGGQDAPGGWLARRLEDEGEAAPEFLEAFRSPQLIAALLGWAYGCDQAPPGPATAAFELAAALAIARLPGDWCSESPEQIARAMGSFVVNAAPVAPSGDDLLAKVRSHWERLEQLGAALVELADAFNATKYTELLKQLQKPPVSEAGGLLVQHSDYRELLKQRPKSPVLEAGALLVQPSGYFIVRERTVLAPGYGGVPVDRVANPREPANIDHARAVPVSSILARGLLPLSSAARDTIERLLVRLLQAHRPATRDGLSL